MGSISASTRDWKQPARDVFFIEGCYVSDKECEVMQGAMFVEHLYCPEEKKSSSPKIIFIHGGSQTAVNWLNTPDGRPGWAEYFVNCGFDVYLVDQPQRGRSAWHPAHDYQLRNTSVQRVEKMFTAPEQFCLWPQAKHHSQWPGKGRKGDPVFDQFYASQVESVASDAITERNLQQSVAKLLDKIGPAILVTHSQSGSAGWAIADIRSLKVQAIIAIEPAGPPIMEHEVFGGKIHLRWGVTHNAIEYSPPLKNATELKLIQEIESQGDDLSHCWLQVQPAHQLPNLANIPVLVLVSEASYHAAYDHCTVQWLRQAGVNVDFIRLKDLNIRGNGHMMMLEKNNIEIAGVVIKWLETHVI